MKDLKQMLNTMEPDEALTVLTPHLKQILAHLDEEARVAFVTTMIDGPGGDKMGSMVNL